MGQVTIYALCDDSGIKYIGQTRLALEARLRQHIATPQGGVALVRWLAGLREQGLVPRIMALETTTEQHVDAAERRHIEEHLARGVLLVNGTYTPATRERVRASMAARWQKRKSQAAEHPEDQDEIRYTLRLPRDLYEQLRVQADAEGFSLHAAMLQALHAYARKGRRVVRGVR